MTVLSQTKNLAEDATEDIGIANSLPENEDERITFLRNDILNHLEALKLPSHSGNGNHPVSKEAIRQSHTFQKNENLDRERRAFGFRWAGLIDKFANGSDINPSAIDPELVPVESEKETGYLFRLATLLWSVPVSRGYGRRIRFLVRDRSNGKLIGVFALGDPVFNLRARDNWIGWNVNDRRARLVHLMDGYVVGAVPPYSDLLCGKLVVSLIGSAEVSRIFSERYKDKAGIISGEQKNAHLALVTITSALGRSSLYNRLRLTCHSNDETNSLLIELKRIGVTQGYGHFQLSNNLFDRVRELLAKEGHPYAAGHQYGQGPNWRLRVMRVGLRRLGLSEELARHGIIREVYAMPLALNCHEFLCGRDNVPQIERPNMATIASAALERWIVPRAMRRPEYKKFQREELLERLSGLNP